MNWVKFVVFSFCLGKCVCLLVCVWYKVWNKVKIISLAGKKFLSFMRLFWRIVFHDWKFFCYYSCVKQWKKVWVGEKVPSFFFVTCEKKNPMKTINSWKNFLKKTCFTQFQTWKKLSIKNVPLFHMKNNTFCWNEKCSLETLNFTQFQLESSIVSNILFFNSVLHTKFSTYFHIDGNSFFFFFLILFLK